jgi:hypothetical protein
MSRGPAPCKECKRRPKEQGRHRCKTCRLRHEPIGEQVAAARKRLAMVPEELRRKRTPKVQALAPAGTAWCAGCQSFRDLEDFAKGATTCRPCASAQAHETRTEKTYGLSGDGYTELLAAQGGRCAICRAKPKSKRLAVDHDHKSGAVRGLLCSRCNHDLMGSAWDSLAIATALWHYLNTPPASGSWLTPERQPRLTTVASAADDLGIVTTRATPAGGDVAADEGGCEREHFLPAGAESVPGKRGVWKVWASSEPSTDPTF